MEKCYVVRHDTDSTEGRGPMKIVKVFKNHDDAVAFVKSKPGIWGQPQPDKPFMLGETESWNMYDITPYNLE